MIDGTHGQDEVINPQKSNKKLKFVSVAIVLSVLVYLSFPTFSRWQSATPSIKAENLLIAAVKRGDLIRDVAVSGKIVAANAPQLYSTEVGKVTLLAKPGEAVEQGQVVAQLLSLELDALIQQQVSTLEQLRIDSSRGTLADKEAQLDLEQSMNAAQSKLNVAKRESERAKISFEKQVMSQMDWMKSQDTLSDAALFFNHAKKRVELAKERLAFESKNRDFLVEKQQLILNELKRRKGALAIKAPVSGIVGNWLVAQKNTIQANTPIMTIVDLSEYEAELSVPEFYADDLGLGLAVTMKIAGAQVAGEIIAISPEINENQVQVRAKITSQNMPALRQNQRLNARIEFEKKSNVLMVKKGAFMGSLGGKFAYRIQQNDENTTKHAEKIAINAGSNSVDYIELLSGVKEGDELIISDYEKFSAAPNIRITY